MFCLNRKGGAEYAVSKINCNTYKAIAKAENGKKNQGMIPIISVLINKNHL
jgi:hypothetical protein